jgi:uncharacterized membrane protein YcaP (DUF421 family)
MGIDWQEIFIPAGSLAAIFVRGTIIYLALFATMRLLPRRTIGTMGASDVLVIVLIADAVQNGMADEYKSVTEGLFLAAVIFGWTLLINWLDHRFHDWHLASAGPLPLIQNGRMLRRNMDREHITEDELMSQLRLHGQESTERVAKAFVEGDGHVSVILTSREPVKPVKDRAQS